MESQIIHDSAPNFDSDSQIESPPSSLVPIIEDIQDFDEIVEDTPERVKKYIIKQETSNLKARKLKFDKPIALFQISKVAENSSKEVNKRYIEQDPRNLKAKRLKIDDTTSLFRNCEVMEDGSEKVKNCEVVEHEPCNLEVEKLKFDDPTGLLHIFLPQLFN